MTQPLRIGIAGLGTVGAGTLSILMHQAQMLAERAGRPIAVTGISAKDKKKDRGIDTSRLAWYDNPVDLAKAADVDVVVETIGGADGAAYDVVKTALSHKKSVVTANKALIAHHGVELAQIAESHGVLLAFEAAVAGGIPIIKALRDGLAANKFHRIMGILNGTCNYILTHMWEDRRSFEHVLKEAQAKGYAEAEPSFDVDGIDTAHKLAILGSLAYGIAPAIDKVHMEGIRRVTLTDMQFADELGYVIKLLGITSQTEAGIELRVHPYMLPKASPIGAVSGVFNAVLVEGDQVGSVLFTGRGAGAGPTASSVVADIIDIARGVAYKPFTLSAAALKPATFAPMDSLQCSYYLRLGVIDQPGVLADVTAIFKQEKISMRSVIQHSHNPGEVVQLVVTTHLTQEAAMMRALAAIEKIGSVKEKPYFIRMEAL